MGYNQRQITTLGIIKDLSDSVRFLAGTLCEILPLWATLLIGSLQNFIWYGWVWLIFSGRAPPLPLSAVWSLVLGIWFSICLILLDYAKWSDP
ncbi:hypothetical protein IEQ34_021665 [Dendrobium chrysotoxum]|uniref:Nodulin-like domain-containing protein n=1 Tax=Dendrobium chrysotoxum TaxID=161865 RepID=A0AAV7G5D6_DENCH|nr:hypothetical protein IEQ34_021665 [Dendrobium chrysotoxum]